MDERTQSLCPVCLKVLEATRRTEGEEAFLEKECPRHGAFRTVIWRGPPALADWRRDKDAVHPDLCYTAVDQGCPYDCGLCRAHEQRPCSVLLEVTQRCNLRCAICFADSGGPGETDLSLEAAAGLLERAMAAAGPTNLQLSGGEPTLRDDLPEIVALARRIGYSFIQVNTNGIRLGKDKNYAARLAAAGLSSVFLQFDATDDTIYRRLRGGELLDVKLQAISNAGESGLGVVLVPTLVAGVNSGSVGDIVRRALRLVPAVRGIHFQPFSHFGRFPQDYEHRRFTLPELMRALEEQTAGLLKVSDFSPPGGEHAHCSFHASYLSAADGVLRPIAQKNGGGMDGGGCCSAEGGKDNIGRTVTSVSRRWTLPSPVAAAGGGCCGPRLTRDDGPLSLDVFLRDASSRSFTISAMAFQDAENLDLERLRGCCISVISAQGNLIPFCAYNLTSRDGRRLYRQDIGAAAV